MLDLSEIDAELLDGRVKGLPDVAPFRLDRIAAQGWNVAAEDLPLPLLTLRESAVAHNLAVMQDYCTRHGVLLAPHGKTTMAPQLFDRQLVAGAWAITAASVQQLQVYRRFGVGRVVFANQLAGRPNVGYVVDQLNRDEEFEFWCFVDSAAGVEQLVESATALGARRPIRVLMDVGHHGGRTGVRDEATLHDVATALERSGGRLVVDGVAGFEGLLRVERHENADDVSAVDAFLDWIARVAERLSDRGLLAADFIASAGGSIAFDRVVAAFTGRWPDARIVLRSGCYLTHDHGMYAAGSPLDGARGLDADAALRPAFDLWSYVQSIPEPGTAILGFGRRDAPYDSGLPVPLWALPRGSRQRVALDGCSIVALNDQHGYLRLPPGAPLRVGDRVVCGISHPCTAFDKWQLIPVLDDSDTVISAVRTFF